MKIIITYCLLSLFLLGCSRKQTDASNASTQAPDKRGIPSPSLPFTVTVVETPEAKEIKQTEREGQSLLEAGKYDELDALAAGLRVSRESYANGVPKLASVYSGLEPSDKAVDAVWKKQLSELQKWVQARPKSITARVALARCLTSYAWQARGFGYADKVTDEGWKLMGERLAEAAKVLGEARKLKERCPVYWSSLMFVALGSQVTKEQYNNIFEAAIKEEPHYHSYYVKRAIFLLPRWYGEEGEWQTDLARYADRLGGEEGDVLYAQVVWQIHHYGSSIDVFEDKKISWERVDRGFAVILKQFPDALAAKNERAHLAALAGDREKARQYFQETQGQVDLSAWQVKEEFVDCANWAFAQ